jgi:hypothetical protein
MIGQNGRPVGALRDRGSAGVRVTAGGVFFSEIHSLALVSDTGCSPNGCGSARPDEWDEPRIAETVEWTEWLRAGAAAMTTPVTLLDTTGIPVGEVTDRVREWILLHLR